MFSDRLKQALEQEIAGQPRAVNTVVRGVTRLISGLTPHERSLSAFLLIGPTGTGKSQLIRTLARSLHGDERRVVVADCTQFVRGDPWATLLAQLAPLFPSRSGGGWPPRIAPCDTWLQPSAPEMVVDPAIQEAPPLSILRVEYLERAPESMIHALSAALESEQIALPDGRRVSLRHCLIFCTSGMCAREILEEASPIGFTGSVEDDDDPEHDQISQLCHEHAEKRFGSDFMGRMDAAVVFRRLEQKHLETILSLRGRRLGNWLATRGFRYELLPAARELLIERGSRNLRLGARHLMRAHQRFVEFPLSDMLVSGRIPAGGSVLVDRKPDENHLHFAVQGPPLPANAARQTPGREIPIDWAV